MTVTSLISIFIATLLAKWSDIRFSRKHILMAAGIAGCIGYLGNAFIREVWALFLIASIFLGISSISFSQLFAHARDLLDRSDIDAEHVPFFMNVFRLFFALSWTVGPALAALIMQHYSFRGTFLVAAFLFLMLVIVVAGGVPALPPTQKSILAAARTPFLTVFRLPGILAHFLAFVLFFSCSTMGMMNLPLLILNTLNGRESDVGIAYSLAPIFEIPFMFYLGFLAIKMPTAKLIRGAVGLAILYYLGLSLIRTPWQVFPLQAVSAAIVAVTSGVAITFFQDLLPDQPGSSTNLYSNAMRIGAILGYLLFGFISSNFGFRMVFTVCSAFCAVALGILFVWGSRTRQP